MSDEDADYDRLTLRQMILDRIESWKSHRLDHGDGSLLMHRLDARIDELHEVLRWIRE